jgi:short-subunit dehydrogenase
MSDIWRGRTALVTGASRGIGATFAELLAARGANLVLVARNAAALDALAGRLEPAGVSVTVIGLDLTAPGAPARLTHDLDGRGIAVDHLVNNAGEGPQGRFQALSVEQHLTTVDLNVRAVVDLSARLLPGMIARRRGGILNVASTAAFQGLQWMPVYSGTKAFVVTWSEAVWVGLRGTGVRCCCCSPGPVNTGYFEANRVTPPPRWIMQSPEAVAGKALRAYERDDCHVLPFLPFRLLAWSTRLVPRSLAARLGGWYGAPPR